MTSVSSLSITDIVKGVAAVQSAVQEKTDGALAGEGGALVSDVVSVASVGTKQLHTMIDTVVEATPPTPERAPATIIDVVKKVASDQAELQNLIETIALGDDTVDVIDFVTLKTEQAEATQALIDEIVMAEQTRPDTRASAMADRADFEAMMDVQVDLDFTPVE